ncbi:MAG: hypothetical protein H6740_29115, partial [Alphaproteobacteria bacterium]|nr:hypothetical protein [Alphaproteobacteria bacterium]
MNMRSLALLLLAACTGADPDSWSTPADCEGLSDQDVRDDCYARVAVPVFTSDRAAGLAMLEKVSDPLVKDYILLKITREVDPTSFQYCDQIQDERLKDRCQVLVRRPHLHRDLQEPGQGG